MTRQVIAFGCPDSSSVQLLIPHTAATSLPYQNDFTPCREDLHFSLRVRYEKTPVCYGYRGLKIIHEFEYCQVNSP